MNSRWLERHGSKGRNGSARLVRRRKDSNRAGRDMTAEDFLVSDDFLEYDLVLGSNSVEDYERRLPVSGWNVRELSKQASSSQDKNVVIPRPTLLRSMENWKLAVFKAGTGSSSVRKKKLITQLIIN